MVCTLNLRLFCASAVVPNAKAIISDKKEIFKFLEEEQKNDTISAKIDLITYSILIKGYAKGNKIAKVSEIYEKISQKKEFKLDEMLYNTILDSYAKQNDEISALKIYEDMKSKNIKIRLGEVKQILAAENKLVTDFGDVYFDKFGPNKLSDFDNELLVKHNPLVITNKYFETGNVKNYNHKLQLGIGCKQKEYSYSTTNRVLFIEPSLNYINSYRDFVKKLYNYEVSTDIKDINNCVLVARPGGGIITYCIEKQIPLVALYDENDSNEILELADKIEELGIGKKHNTNDHFTNPYKDNSIFDSLKIEDNGFKLTADYINKLF